MLGGQHASHLCHQPTCINHEHIHVEDKEDNEKRKDCAGRIMIRTWIGGVQYVFIPKECSCSPPCITMIEDREAVQV